MRRGIRFEESEALPMGRRARFLCAKRVDAGWAMGVEIAMSCLKSGVFRFFFVVWIFAWRGCVVCAQSVRCAGAVRMKRPPRGATAVGMPEVIIACVCRVLT